jgi:hypothetical protein
LDEVNNEKERIWEEKSWPNLKYYLDVCLDRMAYTMRNVSYDSRCPDRDSKWELPEFISEAMRWLASCCFSYKIFMYSSPNIIRTIKSRRMRWAGHVACMGETRNPYRILVGKPEGKRLLGRPRRR